MLDVRYAATTAEVGLPPLKRLSGKSARKGEPARQSRARSKASPRPRGWSWGTNSSSSGPG